MTSAKYYFVGILLSLMVACGSQNEDIQEWIDLQAKEARPNVKPILPPGKFEPEPYSGANGAEPFATGKMVSGTRLDPRGSGAILATEMQRRKQPLEAFPLDSMKMVGTVVKDGNPHGLLRVESLLHYVKVGDYLGQNFGKIMRISEAGIELREIVQDASSEWIERSSTLQLQEAGQ